MAAADQRREQPIAGDLTSKRAESYPALAMPGRDGDGPKKPPVRVAGSEGASRHRSLPVAGEQNTDAPPAYSNSAKLAIFRRLFRGRTDVYPLRWENSRRSKSGYMPDCSNKFVEPICPIRTTKCSKCPNQAFRSFDDTAIAKHLRGRHTMGVYPLLRDGTCWFLALDFDQKAWKADVAAVRKACVRLEVPVYVERSRSGKGAHVWLFFSEAVPAKDARALGRLILSEAQELRPSLQLRSFDRMFPSQDSVEKGGFGNLIALPLQRVPRDQGNSVFVDDDLEPYPGEQQWELLANVSRISPAWLSSLLEAVHRTASPGRRSRGATPRWQTGELFADHGMDGGEVEGSEKRATTATEEPLPHALDVTVRDRVYVRRKGLPGRLESRIQDIAAFSNPEYYRKKAARASLWNTPRVIRCAEVLPAEIALPRGSEPALRSLADDAGLAMRRLDHREAGSAIDVSFQGTLTPVQSEALRALAAHDTGVLVLPPGVGKTVVAAALVARRARSTLVIVNRRPLLDQWRAQLSIFLGIAEKDIGQIGSQIDLATMQSLARNEAHVDSLSRYGHVIVDECHHAAAVSFERVLARIPAKFVLGLTATPKRRDGHHPVMHMQLGPIRFEASPKVLATQRPFTHRYFVRPTEFSSCDPSETLSDLQTRLSDDARRNSFILDDTVAALREGRSPLVLCQRREHVVHLAERLRRYAPNLFVLVGGMNTRERRETFQRLRALEDTEQRLVVATGSYVGEGFDDARLDTLLLAAPISWKGTLAQYAGRLHRLHPDKREVWIFDYVDEDVPVLARMFEKRRRGYKSLGYIEDDPPTDFEIQTDPQMDGDDGWLDVEQALVAG